MFIKLIVCILVISFAVKPVYLDDLTSQNIVMDYEREPNTYENRNDTYYYDDKPRETWMDTAKNMLSGPGITELHFDEAILPATSMCIYLLLFINLFVQVDKLL